MKALPWIQIEAAAFEQHAPVVSRLLKIEPSLALGLLAFLWRWAASQDAVRKTGRVVGVGSADLIEAAAGWKGKRGAFAFALVRAGLCERIPGGYRIKGLDRYAAAFVRQEKARKRLEAYRLREELKRDLGRDETHLKRVRNALHEVEDVDQDLDNLLKGPASDLQRPGGGALGEGASRGAAVVKKGGLS